MKKCIFIISIGLVVLTIIALLPQRLPAQCDCEIRNAIGWYVRDKDLRQQIIVRLREYLEFNDQSRLVKVNLSDDVIVFETVLRPLPDYSLVRLMVCSDRERVVIDGPDSTFIVLGKTFYDYVKDRRNYPWEIWEPPTSLTPCHRLADDVSWWSPTRAQFSVFHSSFKIEKEWGLDGSIGIDQINYPFWYAGVFRAGFIHERVRLGIQGPVRIGFSPGSFRPRQLDAGLGGYIGFNTEGISGELFFSDYVRKLGSEEWRDPNKIYFLTFGGSLGYSFYADISDFMPAALRIYVGGEFHQVGEGRLDSNEKDIVKGNRTYMGGPVIRFDLTECKDNYEAFVQYANSSIMFGGAYNFTRVFGIEARFVMIDPLREYKPWEYPTMFMISPRIRL